METKSVKSKYSTNKEARELKIYNEWKELMSQPGAMITAANQIIMEKYEIYGDTTLWSIRKRVEKRLENQAS